MADVGTGTTIAFGTSLFTAQITAVNGSGVTRVALQTSHMGTTTGHTKIPGDLHDPGTVTLSILWDPSVASDIPPINGAAETVTITLANAGVSTLIGSAFVTGFNFVVPLEELMTADMEITWAAPPTWTP